MSHPMHILVNDFAIRSFRETADKDYITARMAYRARLIQPFRWSALLPGIERMKQHGKFELNISAATVKFIKSLEDDGAEDRYYLASYDIEPFDIARFDRAVWELRRYCQPLDYETVGMNGKTALSCNRPGVDYRESETAFGQQQCGTPSTALMGRKMYLIG